MIGAGNQLDPEEHRCYRNFESNILIRIDTVFISRESFDSFDWNNNGKISYGSLQVSQKIQLQHFHHYRCSGCYHRLDCPFRERCVERASILQTLRYIVISSSSLSSYNCPQKCLFNVLVISKYPHRGQQPTYVNDFCHFVMILTIVFLGSKMVSRFLT